MQRLGLFPFSKKSQGACQSSSFIMVYCGIDRHIEKIHILPFARVETHALSMSANASHGHRKLKPLLSSGIRKPQSKVWQCTNFKFTLGFLLETLFEHVERRIFSVLLMKSMENPTRRQLGEVISGLRSEHKFVFTSMCIQGIKGITEPEIEQRSASE
jgi:hypothetical protein